MISLQVIIICKTLTTGYLHLAYRKKNMSLLLPATNSRNAHALQNMQIYQNLCQCLQRLQMSARLILLTLKCLIVNYTLLMLNLQNYRLNLLKNYQTELMRSTTVPLIRHRIICSKLPVTAESSVLPPDLSIRHLKMIPVQNLMFVSIMFLIFTKKQVTKS